MFTLFVLFWYQNPKVFAVTEFLRALHIKKENTREVEEVSLIPKDVVIVEFNEILYP